jgi:hypothetical protein
LPISFELDHATHLSKALLFFERRGSLYFFGGLPMMVAGLGLAATDRMEKYGECRVNLSPPPGPKKNN